MGRDPAVSVLRGHRRDHHDTQLNERSPSLFVGLSTPTTFPPLVAAYSAVLGVFVPSGGSKWVIEAPYVMPAAHDLQVHLGWMVAVYDLGEALANLVQPFWMLPILGLFGLRARDVMGYTFVVFLCCAAGAGARDGARRDAVVSAVGAAPSRRAMRPRKHADSRRSEGAALEAWPGADGADCGRAAGRRAGTGRR